MIKLIVLAIILIFAVWLFQELKPKCELKFAHSETKTISFVECEGD